MTPPPLATTRRTRIAPGSRRFLLASGMPCLRFVVHERTRSTRTPLDVVAFPLHRGTAKDRVERSGGAYANVGNCSGGDGLDDIDSVDVIRAGARAEWRLAGLCGVCDRARGLSSGYGFENR